jgi:hypothetical protein
VALRCCGYEQCPAPSLEVFALVAVPRFPMSSPTFQSVSVTFEPVPSIRPWGIRARAASTILPLVMRERGEQGRLLHGGAGHHSVQGR